MTTKTDMRFALLLCERDWKDIDDKWIDFRKNRFLGERG